MHQHKIQIDRSIIATRGHGVKIGVCDTWTDVDCPLFSDNIKKVYRCASLVKQRAGTNISHGTFITGMIADIAPDAELYVAMVSNTKTDGKLSDLRTGLEWLSAQGLDLINMSLAFSHDDNEIKTVLSETVKAGCRVIVPAIPNNYPSEYDFTVSVGGFVNNSTYDVLAPESYTLDIEGKKVSQTGVSMSTAYYTGVSACFLSYKKGFDPLQMTIGGDGHENQTPYKTVII